MGQKECPGGNMFGAGCLILCLKTKKPCLLKDRADAQQRRLCLAGAQQQSQQVERGATYLIRRLVD